MNDVSVYSVAEDTVYMVYSVVNLIWWFGKFCTDCQTERTSSIYCKQLMSYFPCTTQNHQSI